MALMFSRSAAKALRLMPKGEAAQLIDRLKAIAADAKGPHASTLAMVGEPAGRFRVRQGDWRAVFRLDGADVVVDRIGQRREVYE
jgi:mRNA interferase RelE/StbE